LFISKKTLYAIKALTYLAAMKKDRFYSINDISGHEKIPREYMAKILKELTQKGIIKSKKGVAGGYKMLKSPDKLSFWDVLTAMQGSLEIASRGVKPMADKYYKGAAQSFWKDFHREVKYKLSKMTLDKIEYKKFYPTR